jgi:hypothetical protein
MKEHVVHVNLARDSNEPSLPHADDTFKARRNVFKVTKILKEDFSSFDKLEVGNLYILFLVVKVKTKLN